MQAQIIYKLEWCTYPMGIEYAGIDPIQVESYAHILQELNMRAHHTNFAYISIGNWTCRCSRRGRDRGRDQGQPNVKASPEQGEWLIILESLKEKTKVLPNKNIYLYH